MYFNETANLLFKILVFIFFKENFSMILINTLVYTLFLFVHVQNIQSFIFESMKVIGFLND